jgi:ribonuclease Z
LFELTFLGTSAMAPSIHRGLSAQIVSYRDQRFLIDCGEGTQRQILRSGLGFRRLNHILITHGHLDHILGLAGLLSTFSRWDALEHLEIWAGEWAMKRIHDLLFGVVFPGAKPPMEIELHIIEAGPILEFEDLKVSAFPVEHRGPGCFGFLFEEPTRRPFLPEKADALGIPHGPIRGKLVAGKKAKLPDGRTIKSDEVLGPARPGVRLVHVGDCASTMSLKKVTQDADALVIEATYRERERDLAQKFGHLTATQAAQLAKDTGVGQLFLTHISGRYREHDLLDEARQIFPDTKVARDFDHVQIKRASEET